MEVRPGNPRYPYKPPIPLTVIVNPAIEPLDEEIAQINEGCLSVPDLRGEVPRHVSIRLRYLDREGAEHEEVKRGLTAGTFQHELDHLDGTLFVDRVDRSSDADAPADQFERFHRDAFVARARRARGAGRLVTAYWCELAWLGGPTAEAGVLVDVEDGRIAAVTPATRTCRRPARGASMG